MVYRIVFILGISFLLNSVEAQIIPDDRKVDWNNVVGNHYFDYPVQQVNVNDFGAVGDGIINDQPAIQSAIDSFNGRLGMVYLPSGNYLLTSPITLTDSVLIRGNTSDSTTMLFQFGQQAINCINIQKGQSGAFVAITDGFAKYSPWIQVNNPSAFSPGQTIEIRQQNGDWDVVPISWADYSVGQITRITTIVNNKLYLESPLRIDFSPELNPEVRPLNPIHNAGVECMKIKRLDAPAEGAGSNISFSYAANCVVRGVESDSSLGSHINVNASAYLLIQGNYIHHGFTYDGAGTRGYGVTFSMHSSECLMTNNIFRKLRHAMMVKTGSNGNVIAYNYSIEPIRSEAISDFSGDINLHGHYAYANLFEGNIVQNIIIDHYWGPSGPLNTFFRNRAELYGIFMTNSELLMTDRQNFVGNEVTNNNFLYGFYFLTGTDHFEFGNNIKGTIIPAGTEDLPDLSYYLQEKPDFWNNNEWPSIGIPNPISSGTIPAKQRYQLGAFLTVCPPDSTITNIKETIGKNQFRIWPNPTSSELWISTFLAGTATFQLITLQGQLVDQQEIRTEGTSPAHINLHDDLSPGIYIVLLHQNKKQERFKIWITP